MFFVNFPHCALRIDLHARNTWQRWATALTNASRGGHNEAIKVLCDHGATVTFEEVPTYRNIHDFIPLFSKYAFFSLLDRMVNHHLIIKVVNIFEDI